MNTEHTPASAEQPALTATAFLDFQDRTSPTSGAKPPMLASAGRESEKRRVTPSTSAVTQEN